MQRPPKSPTNENNIKKKPKYKLTVKHDPPGPIK